MTWLKKGPLVSSSEVNYLIRKIRGKRFLRKLYLNVQDDLPISRIPKGSVLVPGFRFKARKK